MECLSFFLPILVSMHWAFTPCYFLLGPSTEVLSLLESLLILPAWTAITKYHWLTSNRNLFLLGAGPGSLRSGCQHPPLDCTLLTSHCILTWQRAEQGRKLSYDSYKGTNSVYEGCILMTSSDPNYFPRTLLLIPSHWGIEFQHLSFGGKKKYSVHKTACEEKKVLTKSQTLIQFLS